jgi:hypothetical protein
MRCIFCLEEQPPSDEHVFPLAIGGSLHTDRVCGPCNSTLGKVADGPLTNHLLIAARRCQLKLPGNSGEVPDARKILLGEGVLASDPSQRIRIAENSQTGRLEPQVIYNSKEITLPDGTVAKQIVIDGGGSDAELRKIIARERKRAGLNPLSEADLHALANVLRQNIQTAEQPTVKYDIEIDTTEFSRGLFKIAYELAHLWLGESYLDDSVAAKLRAISLAKIRPDQAKIVAAVQFGSGAWPLVDKI